MHSSHLANDESYADRVVRITKRDLLRSHRAQPVLVESLLLVAQVNTRHKNNEKALSMQLILNLCPFAQKMRWLCPWGEELIDEGCRPPMRAIPEALRSTIGAAELNDTLPQWMTEGQLRRMVADESEQWDRIFTHDLQELRFLQHLDKHPCEEVHMMGCGDIKSNHLEHLAGCRSLRALTIDAANAPKGFVSALQAVQGLEVLDTRLTFTGVAAMKRQIEMHRRLPSLKSLEIDILGDFDATVLIEFIRERNSYLKHFGFRGRFSRSIAAALATCENLLTLRIEDHGVTFNDIEPILTSEHLQKTVRLVKFDETTNIEHFRGLERFTALRWVWLDDTDITNEDLQAVMLVNAQHLVEVSVQHCPNITKEIFDCVDKCTGLHSVDLSGCAIAFADMLEYKRAKRRNYKALMMTYSGIDGDEEMDENVDESDAGSDVD